MLNIKEIKNVPSTVKQAALLLLLYGLWVLITGMYFGYQSNFENTKEIIRAIGRFLVFTYIAWYLLSLKNASWWCAVIFSAVLTALGIVGVVMLTFAIVTIDKNSDLINALVTTIPPLYFLSHALFILLRTSVRSLFLNEKSEIA